jgi:peptidoglycan/LPS O-acetylase OafA/YrhL
MKQHLREFDFIRAAAALSVIAIHISGRYAYSSKAGYVWNQSMRYAVPLFIIISGFLLYYSDLGKDKVSFTVFLTKRFRKVFIPYLIWSAVYVVYSRRHDFEALWPINGKAVAGFLRNLLLGNAAFHLYFIVIILQLYLIYLPLRRLLLKLPKTVLGMSFAVTFCFQTSIYFVQLKLLVLPGTPFPYFIMFPAWLFYFVLGMYSAGCMEKWCNKLRGREGFLAAACGASFLILIADSIFTNTFESSVRPSVMLYCLTCSLFLYAAAYRFKDSRSLLAELLDWISRQSFIMYLSHILILNLAFSLWNFLGLGGVLKGSVEMIIMFFCVTAGTLAFVYAVSFTPLAPYLGGIAARRRMPFTALSSGNDSKAAM